MEHSELIELVAASQFVIKGYKAADGNVYDLLVTRLPPGECYTHLVRRALGAVMRMEKPEEFDEQTWEAAVKGQSEAWLKHLHENGDKVKIDAFVDIPAYELIDPQDVSAGIQIPSVLVDRTLVSGSIAEPKGSVPRAKAAMRSMVELGRFVSKLILAPGKYEEVCRVS